MESENAELQKENKQLKRLLNGEDAVDKEDEENNISISSCSESE